MSKSRHKETHGEFSDGRNETAVELKASRKQPRVGSQSSDSDSKGLVRGYTGHAEALTEQGRYPHENSVPGDGIHMEREFMFRSDPVA
ncbi:hypothetical protein MMC14_007837 [Varicellaria rhodocarpa]|nr:hypothetical protein [Varicellaria rhodocarpa]